MNKLTELYSSIITSTGFSVTNDHHIVSTDNEPVTLIYKGSERSLILPTKEAMTTKDWTKVIAFHPGCESIVSGQSEVLNMLTVMVGKRLCSTMVNIFAAIISLSENKTVHGTLKLSTREIITRFEPVDKTTLKLSVDLIKRNTGISGKVPFLSINYKRGEVIGDVNYSRTCHLEKRVLQNAKTLCGITPTSEKSNRIVREVLDFIFPEVLVYGSNSSTMPYFIALLELYYNTAKHLNTIRIDLGVTGNAIEEIPLGWYDKIGELPSLVKMHLPQSLSGNEGKSIKNKETEVSEQVDTNGLSEIQQLAANKVIDIPTSGAMDVNASGLRPLPPRDNTTINRMHYPPVPPVTHVIPPVNYGHNPVYGQQQSNYGVQGGYQPNRPMESPNAPMTTSDLIYAAAATMAPTEYTRVPSGPVRGARMPERPSVYGYDDFHNRGYGRTNAGRGYL
jgi:hypothetical protein